MIDWSKLKKNQIREIGRFFSQMCVSFLFTAVLNGSSQFKFQTNLHSHYIHGGKKPKTQLSGLSISTVPASGP